MRPEPLDATALAQLFDQAQTHYAWIDRPVPDEILRRIYDLAKMGPTSANSQPMRVIFARSAEARARLDPFLMGANRGKTLAAPVTAIIGHDVEFYDKLGKLMPARPEMRGAFAGMPEPVRERLAFQGASLQAAYLILAARALGLDCGPMGGFDRDAVDAAFFPDGKTRSGLLVNLGYGDATKLYPRQPRLDFDEACRIV